MPLIVFSHPDGGHYVVEEEYGLSMKMDDGRWEPAILYRRVVANMGRSPKWAYEGPSKYVTTKTRWSERFTPVEMSNGQPLHGVQ